MNKHKRAVVYISTMALVVICLAVFAPNAPAQSLDPEEVSDVLLTNNCYASDLPSYNAEVRAKPGTYDVFVKMGRRGQTTQTALYVEDNGTESCQDIGSIIANGDHWQKIGAWTATDDTAFNFVLASELFDSLPDANRPTVMLVPQTNPPCQPKVNCDFTYQNLPAFILPPGTLLSEDELRVLQVQPLEGDVISKVDYYSDGLLLYTKPNLQPFDLRYVPGGEHTLSRVLEYKSGQKVVLQSPVYVSFAKDFQNLLFRLFNSNRVGLQIIASLAVVAIISLVVLSVLHALHRRHVWKLNHGLLQEKLVAPPPGTLPSTYVPPPHFLSEDAPLIKNMKRYTPLVLVAVTTFAIIGLSNTYVMQLFRVEGVSMETTLQTDNQMLVNKLPQTWASLNHHEYIPKRGEVVVIHKAHSDLFLESNQEEKNTYVVKRVLGLPGERVAIRSGVVTVYNKQNPKGFNPDVGSSWQAHLTLDPKENIDVKLDPGEIFVSGDNRPESLDSRANGPVRVSDLVGQAIIRLLPINQIRLL